MRAAAAALLLVGLLLAIVPAGSSARKAALFSADFEGDLSGWVGKNGGQHHGRIVDDPLRSGNHVLTFSSTNSAGDIFSPLIPVSRNATYTLSFQYLGQGAAGPLGGFIGISLATPGEHRWLAGTDAGQAESIHLVDDGKWHTHTITFSPGGHTWSAPDGSHAVTPDTITAVRIMLEDNAGSPGDVFFDNISLTAGGAAGPPSGSGKGSITVNGKAFTSGPVPFGSTIDVTHGSITLKTSAGTVTAYGDGKHLARFVLRKAGKVVELALVGGNFAQCGARLLTAAAKGKKTVRALWGKGKGKFRTRGKHAAATVRGTTWLVADRCDGTLTSVKAGVVSVQDFTRHKTVTVRAGKSYLAPSHR